MTAPSPRARMVEAAARLLSALSDQEQTHVWRLVHGPLGCGVTGCPNDRDGYHDLCAGHRQRLRRHGDVREDIPLRPYRRQPRAATSDQGAAA